jgi:glycine cleavage system H protein
VAVVLTILTFAVIVLIDYLIRRKLAEAKQAEAASAIPAETEAELQPAWVAGYQFKEGLHYHLGHSWARQTGPDVVTVGLDDFARRLIGRVSELKLPSIGTWLHQGAAAFRLNSNGRSAGLVSPVEGEVIEVNRNAKRDPSVVASDPLGRGWLFKVRTADVPANFRNLLTGRIARRWLEDAREQLDLRLVFLTGSVIQDGAGPPLDLAEKLEPEDWRSLARQFFLV